MTSRGVWRLRFVLVEKDGDRPEDMALGDSFDVRLEASIPIIVGRAPFADVLVSAPSVGRKVYAINCGLREAAKFLDWRVRL